MEFWLFFGQDRPFYRTNLQTDATVDTGRKVDPIPVVSVGVFSGTRMDAGDGASIDAIRYAFAGFGHDGMGQGVDSFDRRNLFFGSYNRLLAKVQKVPFFKEDLGRSTRS